MYIDYLKGKDGYHFLNYTCVVTICYQWHDVLVLKMLYFKALAHASDVDMFKTQERLTFMISFFDLFMA